jgi:two-component system sensor histidine kinase AtoS
MVQVFLNLILNSIQAIPQDKKGTVTIASKQLNSNELAVSITDNGCGISAENLEKLFTPFFTTKEKGTGLGLSIINKIVEEHLGEIKVESVVDKGTTFTVVLPLNS